MLISLQIIRTPKKSAALFFSQRQPSARRIVTNSIPTPPGNSYCLRSTSSYPHAAYNLTPGNVATSSATLNPSLSASASHRSSNILPIPLRAKSGCTKNARIRAASFRGSNNSGSLPACASLPNNVFLRLHPPHATNLLSRSTTKYVPSRINCVSTPHAPCNAASICSSA